MRPCVRAYVVMRMQMRTHEKCRVAHVACRRCATLPGMCHAARRTQRAWAAHRSPTRAAQSACGAQPCLPARRATRKASQWLHLPVRLCLSGRLNANKRESAILRIAAEWEAGRSGNHLASVTNALSAILRADHWCECANVVTALLGFSRETLFLGDRTSQRTVHGLRVLKGNSVRTRRSNPRHAASHRLQAKLARSITRPTCL